MKFQRQAKILEIISEHKVETQEELSDRLRAVGFSTTQATISRDIKELRIVKLADPGGRSYYAVSNSEADSSLATRLSTIFRESVISFDCAENIIVIKTLPALASAACSAIDAMRSDRIVGTLAGDDTGILIMRSKEAAADFADQIRTLLG